MERVRDDTRSRTGPAAALARSLPIIRWWARRVRVGLLGALELVPAQGAAAPSSSRACTVGVRGREIAIAQWPGHAGGLRDTLIVAPPLVITRAEIDEPAVDRGALAGRMAPGSSSGLA
jgi:adenosylmethionine-8-amino-7-oxononanoate aminotransferase